MAPNRFRHKEREKREVTPFAELPEVATENIPLQWRHIEAPPNFTWVGQDELAGMGWPKSRDQVRFLISQGIDHLITLSADKIPPYYAFPELKWSLISVEDFTGPCIRDIKKFINEMDKARMEGEAIGVHCAEGRGRTGVMCACYLIYYHDLKPWDAIRVMRRQRPGSVERKIQEDTVVLFYKLLQDYGKESLEILDEKEKEYRDLKKMEKEKAVNCENILQLHTASFYGPLSKSEGKTNRFDRLQRLGRSRSMPKMTPEEEAAERQEISFKKHIQKFYDDDRSRGKEKVSFQDTEQNLRAITPGRLLIDNLKPITRKTDTKTNFSFPKNDLSRHFKDFMSSNSMNLKRVRSFSQPKDMQKPVNKTIFQNIGKYDPCLHLSHIDKNKHIFYLEKTSGNFTSKNDVMKDKNNHNSIIPEVSRDRIIYKKSKTTPLSNIESKCKFDCSFYSMSNEKDNYVMDSKFSSSIENCVAYEIPRKNLTKFNRGNWHRVHTKFNHSDHDSFL